MSSPQQWDHQMPQQPDLDENYWAALLRDDEIPISEIQLFAGYRTQSVSPPAPPSPAKAMSADPTTHDVHNVHDNSWMHLRSIHENDETIALPVVGHNRGGLLVEWGRLRGFVPASQLVDFPTTNNPIARRKALVDRIGQTIVLRVIELNEAQNRLILSERAARVRPGERIGLLERLASGHIVEGTVTNLCDFGAFVDLGGLEGLIHISELSWGRVNHPGDLLKRGQTVRTYVLNVNKASGRIALSVKRLFPDPWQTVHHRYAIGQIVTATITNVVDFGAFARIEDGLEGLIHVSELAEGQFLHPRNVVLEGQTIRVRILSIDGHARRLGLSLRALGDGFSSSAAIHP